MTDETNTTASDRKPWIKPELTLMEAGTAQFGGATQSDGGAIAQS